jgi:two-component system CheB/CheR fusion protein
MNINTIHITGNLTEDPERRYTPSGKAAEFPVEQAREGAKIFPDHLYVITPNTTLTLGGGVLHLRNRDPAERPHRPVDTFFHSLAQERGANAIGIILSGSGTDGAKGIQAVKQAGGITFAQDKSSALFYGMPNSAIRTGCVDFILSPGDIAQELINISLDFRGTNPDC